MSAVLMLLYKNWIIVEICTLVRVEMFERNPDLLWLRLNPVGLNSHTQSCRNQSTKRTLSQIGHNSFQKILSHYCYFTSLGALLLNSNNFCLKQVNTSLHHSLRLSFFIQHKLVLTDPRDTNFTF